MKKDYKNEEITVVWKPEVCIHSEKCFHGLGSVFNPNNRPWVNLDGAENNRIIEQVNACPSGALSGFYNSEGPKKASNGTQNKATITPNGPILIEGPVEIDYKGASEIRETKVTALCRCGASNNTPYCDGSHAKIGFSD